MRSLAGSEENQQAIYEFAAEVFEHLIQQTDGDVALAMSKLQAGMSNPEAFAKSLPTPLQTKLKKLGARMPASQPKTTP